MNSVVLVDLLLFSYSHDLHEEISFSRFTHSTVQYGWQQWTIKTDQIRADIEKLPKLHNLSKWRWFAN